MDLFNLKKLFTLVCLFLFCSLLTPYQAAAYTVAVNLVGDRLDVTTTLTAADLTQAQLANPTCPIGVWSLVLTGVDMSGLTYNSYVPDTFLSKSKLVQTQTLSYDGIGFKSESFPGVDRLIFGLQFRDTNNPNCDFTYPSDSMMPLTLSVLEDQKSWALAHINMLFSQFPNAIYDSTAVK